jgi:hypothetical protein
MTATWSRIRQRAELAVVGVVVTLLLGVAFMIPTAEGTSDYSPAGWLYNRGVNASGATVINDGTNLPVSTAVSTWNSWIGSTKFTTSTSTSGCGSTKSCIIFDNDGTNVTINGTVCSTPEAGLWAAAYIEAGSGYDNYPGCGAGTATYPVFIIAYNDEGGYGTTARTHIANHEMAHAVKLADENHTCWTSGVTYPLLNNGTFGTCASYPANTTAVAGEIARAKSRMGW